MWPFGSGRKPTRFSPLPLPISRVRTAYKVGSPSSLYFYPWLESASSCCSLDTYMMPCCLPQPGLNATILGGTHLRIYRWTERQINMSCLTHCACQSLIQGCHSAAALYEALCPNPASTRHYGLKILKRAETSSEKLGLFWHAP